MRLKARGKLKSEVCKCPDGNFGRSWKMIFKKADIKDGIFHDLRSTCIPEWLKKGMMPHEIQRLSGHASIDTTMKYYAGIREFMIDRARKASVAALGENSVADLLQTAQNGSIGKKRAASRTSQLPHTAGATKLGVGGRF